MGQMDGMVAIVTGASRGLGRAIAREYAREGASVVISARSQSPTGLAGTIEETAREIRDAGGEVLATVCDVTDEVQVNEMVRQAVERYGKIDVLFNNAGTMVLGESILEIDPTRWDQLIRVNVGGPYLCSAGRAAHNDGTAARGSIINIGSRMATDPAQGGGRAVQRQQGGSPHVQPMPGRRSERLQHCREHSQPRLPAQRRLGGYSLDATGLAREGGPQRGGPQRRVPGPAGCRQLYRTVGRQGGVWRYMGTGGSGLLIAIVSLVPKPVCWGYITSYLRAVFLS